MALTNASTLAQIRTELMANRQYRVSGSVSMCATFIDACSWFLLKVHKSVTHGGRDADSYEIDPNIVSRWLSEAEAWQAVNDPNALSAASGGGVVTLQTSPDFRR